MLFRAEGSREIVTSEVAAGSTSFTSFELNDIQKANVDWKDAWYALFDWVEFNKELGRVFCKICKEGGGKYGMLMRDQPTLKFQLCKIMQKLMNIENSLGQNMGVKNLCRRL